MNNGIVAVMVVGVGGVMAGQTSASGDTQSHPKVSFGGGCKSQKSMAARLLPFVFQTVRNIIITFVLQGIDQSCYQSIIGKNQNVTMKEVNKDFVWAPGATDLD